jgi:hypothetical protein
LIEGLKTPHLKIQNVTNVIQGFRLGWILWNELGNGKWRTERKRPLGKPRRRWEDNIRKALREVGWKSMN